MRQQSNMNRLTRLTLPTRLTLLYISLCAVLCGLTSCVDEKSEVSLDGVMCLDPEVRERYLSGGSPSELKDLQGVWSLEVQRCVFTEELEEKSLAEWRAVRSTPFVVRFDQTSSQLSFEGLNGTSFEGSALVLTSQGVNPTFDQAPSSLILELPYTPYDEVEGEGEGVMRLELMFEGGTELLLSEEEKALYPSIYETITGRAYRLDGAQVGLFRLQQHLRAQESSP